MKKSINQIINVKKRIEEQSEKNIIEELKNQFNDPNIANNIADIIPYIEFEMNKLKKSAKNIILK
ncbi:hypothetical protein M0R19_03265 [Candidatus Pacearchaeota archaeon]|jgi:DNA-directed RNA polymerase subunit F|nr:hypothetical protein [Candidatus Pacearchaeota archaeon]